ncbi:MAG TPA: hypothetical protein PLC65_19395 [Bacteroidia bacterium]|nr:hypothetical protein [Bacteroidia bacterium]
MKAIISHDIDHITVSEHLLRDMIVPKFMVRTNIELALGKIGWQEYFLRWNDFLKNKWQNIDELISFNKTKNIPSTFFIGVDKGIGLNYSNSAAAVWVKRIIEQGATVGIHGICFQSLEKVKNEKQCFEKAFNIKPKGMRMHYVKRNENTLNYFNEAGYLFDTTVHSFENPYKVGTMWEFPFQIMDGWIIENGKKWQSRNLEECKEATKKSIDKAFENNLNYIGIDFHDRYFSQSFKTWMNWYIWLCDYLIENKIAFTSFENAMSELESQTQTKLQATL